jgi:hypothetical protein
MGQAIIKFLAFDIILDALFVPVWWYSLGLLATLRKLMRAFQTGVAIVGIDIWTKSIFKPMYGEYSMQGRVISFFMRLVVLLFMILQMGVWILILLGLLLIWLTLPVVLAWQIIRVFTVL